MSSSSTPSGESVGAEAAGRTAAEPRHGSSSATPPPPSSADDGEQGAGADAHRGEAGEATRVISGATAGESAAAAYAKGSETAATASASPPADGDPVVGDPEGDDLAGDAGDVVAADIHAMVVAERDEFKDTALRLQADFENFRKQAQKRHGEAVERAAESLVIALLPVLDAFDAAVTHHPDDEALTALSGALWGVLDGAGVERIDTAGVDFDPELHDAVATVPADDDGEAPDQPLVAQVMRAGYRLKGRTLRAAMVSVTGT